MTEMREARIVMPGVYAIGSKPHDDLRAALCGAFGGFTMTYGLGGWVDASGNVIRDSVCIYDVAMEQTRKNDSKLRDIACEAGCALRQQSVYLRYSSGATAIISLAPAPATLAAKPEPEERGVGLDTYEQLGDLSSMRGKADPYLTHAYTSGKRLPQVGEVWLARDGSTRIAVLKQTTLLDGGFDCVTLTRGATALKEGYPIVVDLDGRYIRGVPQESHPLDLVTYKSTFLA